MKYFYVLLSGILFGLGIAVSGMANPAKVQNFLDIFGTWDPSLALVMGAALLVVTPGYRLIFSAQKPRFAETFSLPQKSDIDRKLVGGAVLFGVGWGISGLCPAPALVAMLTGIGQFVIFALAMLTGMVLYKQFVLLQGSVNTATVNTETNNDKR
ncbi:YeeE/YedE family protein [Spongiibacter sp. KMU-166]|uniref:YeeE/YedE family protein n=1 Tax=Spongiibacter thalassae TaxID=2721624 RepID=A0ABX1GE67_9GAMM|nr:YeeE/YedE family protein [Spongiibacter thalassae]